MSELIERLLAEETDLTDCAADRIEQLERERDEAMMTGHDLAKIEYRDLVGGLEAKLAKAMEYLRKIAAYTHIGTHEQGIVQNAEARIACTALAELEKME